MPGNRIHSVANLAQLFDDAESVLVIRLPFFSSEYVHDASLPGVQAIVTEMSRKALGPDALVVPGADGFLVVSGHSSVDDGEFSKDEYAEELERRLVEANFEEVISVGEMSIQTLSTSAATRFVDMDHETFIAQSEGQRFQILNEISAGISDGAIDGLPLAEGRDFVRVATFLSYRNMPRPGPLAFTHRDSYADPNPLCGAIDLALLRTAVERKLDEMEAGQVGPIIVPLHMSNINDNRYWRMYEVELRNIPQFAKRFVGVELVRVQAGTPIGRIADAVTRLRTQVRTIYLSVPLDWRNVEEFAYLGATGLAATYPIGPGRRHQASHWARYVDLVRRLRKVVRPVVAQNLDMDQIWDLKKTCGLDLVIPNPDSADSVQALCKYGVQDVAIDL